MLLDIDHSKALLTAALETGLPVWVGLSCCISKFDNSVIGRNFRAEKEKSLIYDENKYQEQPKYLPEDEIILLEEIVKSLTNIGGDVYGIMHSWFQDSREGLKIIKENWDGPIMFYPEIHKFDTNTHKAIVTTTENEFVNSFEELIDDQIKIIGGCCGVNDKHLKELIKKYN
jgi:S-methylmethionine-dependent homocysteine/selenocysteine methylase